MEISNNDWKSNNILKCPYYVLYTRCLRCPQNVYVYAKIPHRSFIITFWNAHFKWKQKYAVFISLNANELLLPATFSRIGQCLYSSYLRCSAKTKHAFDYHVSFWKLICMHVKAIHISLNFWYTVFWVHTSEQYAQKWLSHGMWELNEDLFHVLLHLNWQIHTRLCQKHK